MAINRDFKAVNEYGLGATNKENLSKPPSTMFGLVISGYTY